MSFTTSVVLIAVLDVLIVAALAGVCLIPFRLDRRPAATAQVRRLGSPDLLEAEAAAA
jgi:hypothetical protein